jgi:hypothetical protein
VTNGIGSGVLFDEGERRVISVRVELSEDHAVIGGFAFEVLPRIGEEITVPWADDSFGVRVFTVDEVLHFAERVPAEISAISPATVLRVTEIT